MKTDIFEIMYLKGDITWWEMMLYPILLIAGLSILYFVLYFVGEVRKSYKK